MYGITVSIGLPNYGLAIIFMTIVIKLILFPITQKQLKSMRVMQEMQPKLKYYQEKYKDNPEMMQKKVMELYQQYGVNPLSGCLPLLIQMPIFIAFYQSLYNFKFVEEAHAGFLWIPNIGQPDPYLILAVLAGLTTYWQQKVSMVQSNDPTQKTMLYFMPVFMAFIAYKLPAGLPLYWVMFNTLGIMQQLYVNKTQKKLTVETASGVGVDLNEDSPSKRPNKAVAENKNSAKVKEKNKKEAAKQATNKKQEKKGKKTANQPVSGRDKGGKKKNENPNSRKKGKKR